jgi:hypothetical protein
MIYLLLIIPHMAAIAGLLLLALRTKPFAESEGPPGGSFGSDGTPTPPPATPPGGSPQSPREVPPRRRLRDAERESKLYPGRQREHPARQPAPARRADISG